VEELTIKDLLEAGVHFGHQARRWNPKMKKFIFTERNGIYIIDLQKTLEFIKKACDIVREIVARGETVLFVGTKPQAVGIIKEEAERSGQFYVINRWLGGMLTNYRTIRQSVKRLEHFERMSTDGTYELITKKEIQNAEKQKSKLQQVLGGIREMNKIPGLLVVVDTKRESIAVKEANRLGVPVCAIIDTNCDPDPIDYPIPGNDDAIRSIKTILSKITDAIIEGTQMRVDEETVSLMESDKEIEKEKPEKSIKQKDSPAKFEAKKEEEKEKKDTEKTSTKEKIIKPTRGKAEGIEKNLKDKDFRKGYKKHPKKAISEKDMIKTSTADRKVGKETKTKENKGTKTSDNSKNPNKKSETSITK